MTLNKNMLRFFKLAATVAAVLPLQAVASTVIDPTGDFLPSFVGPRNSDLDVQRLTVALDGANFRINALLAGAVGQTAGGFYVLGVNRGAGTARFAANDPNLTRVLFDSVFIINQDGTGSLNLINGQPATQLAPGAISFNGNQINLLLPVALLPSLGFSLDRYGFVLWPRSPGAGFTFIAEFAPGTDTLAAIPEPASWAMMISGFGIIGATARRRRNRPALA